MGGILVILPVLFVPYFADEIRVPKIAALILCAGIIGAYFAWQYIHLSLGVAVGACFVSAVFSGLGLPQQNALICLMAPIIFSSFVVNPTEKEIDRFFLFLIIGGVLNAIQGYCQMANHDFIFFYVPGSKMSTPVGFLGQHTLFGPFVASCITAALFRRNYWFALFMLPPCLATNSSFTFASLGAGAVAFIYAQGFKKTAISIGVAGLSAVPILYQFYTFRYAHLFDAMGRYEIWSQIFYAAKEKWIIGHGFGTFETFMPYIETEEFYKLHGLFKQAHCDYLELFFNMGLLGIIPAAYMLFAFFKSAYKNQDNRLVMGAAAVTLVYLVNAVGNFPFRLVPQGLIALLGWVIVVTYKEREYV